MMEEKQESQAVESPEDRLKALTASLKNSVAVFDSDEGKRVRQILAASTLVGLAFGVFFWAISGFLNLVSGISLSSWFYFAFVSFLSLCVMLQIGFSKAISKRQATIVELGNPNDFLEQLKAQVNKMCQSFVVVLLMPLVLLVASLLLFQISITFGKAVIASGKISVDQSILFAAIATLSCFFFTAIIVVVHVKEVFGLVYVSSVGFMWTSEKIVDTIHEFGESMEIQMELNASHTDLLKTQIEIVGILAERDKASEFAKEELTIPNQGSRPEPPIA